MYDEYAQDGTVASVTFKYSYVTLNVRENHKHKHFYKDLLFEI